MPTIVTLRPPDACAPCGGAERGWHDPGGCASSVGSHVSSYGDGCSADTYVSQLISLRLRPGKTDGDRLAERVGFEPTDRVNDQRFSRPPHSTTLAPLPIHGSTMVQVPLRLLVAAHPAALRNGGEGGIRTHGRVSPTHTFQACSFGHSDTSPFLSRSDVYCRSAAKNLLNSSRLSSARTPEHTSARWFSRGSCTRFPSEPQ